MTRRHHRPHFKKFLRQKIGRITWPGFAGRIVLLVIGMLLAVQLVGLMLDDGNGWQTDKPEEIVAQQVIAATLLLDKSTPSERKAISAALSGILMQVAIDDEPSSEEFHDPDLRDLQEEVNDLLSPLDDHAIRVGYRDGWGREEAITLSIQLLDGNWVIYRMPIVTFSYYEQEGSGWGNVFFWLIVIGAVFWFSNRLARPLRTFAEAAERLGRDVNITPLPVSGSREIRRATTAFNNMQTRVQRMVDDRSLMLAAIAHDLRTVLTRLRLRAEYIEDQEQLSKAAADIEEMQSMLDAGLAFARGETEVEERRITDLSALVKDLAEDFTQTDGPVTYSGPDHFSYRCGPTEIKRALSNLIRNAITYGKRAQVRLVTGPDDVRISISDEGPGISKELQEQVFQPFFRVEGSRNRETGGTGLGLAIARTIARRHGGDITLENKETGGLTATLTLPTASG